MSCTCILVRLYGNAGHGLDACEGADINAVQGSMHSLMLPRIHLMCNGNKTFCSKKSMLAGAAYSANTINLVAFRAEKGTDAAYTPENTVHHSDGF